MALEGSAIEGEINTPTMSVRLENYRWECPSETDYRIPDYSLFRTLAPKPSRSQVTPISKHRWSADFEGLGLWPAATPLHFTTSRRSLRIVYCTFPLQQLEALTGFGTVWGLGDDLRSCFELHNPRLDYAVLRMAEEALDPGFGAAVTIEGTGMAMAIELARHIQRRDTVAEFKTGGLSPRQLRRIVDFIGDIDTGCPSIAELAQLCDISERHLMRVFKDTTGLTVGAYVEQMRTGRARDLLHRNLPVKEIGAQLGFSSASHFSAAFRKATGMTPTAYRRQIRP
jgi:AraC family transcriptional regulator